MCDRWLADTSSSTVQCQPVSCQAVNWLILPDRDTPKPADSKHEANRVNERKDALIYHYVHHCIYCIITPKTRQYKDVLRHVVPGLQWLMIHKQATKI